MSQFDVTWEVNRPVAFGQDSVLYKHVAYARPDTGQGKGLVLEVYEYRGKATGAVELIKSSYLKVMFFNGGVTNSCLLYTSPSPRDISG